MRAEGVTLAEARTTATIVLFAVAFWVLGAVARPLNAARTALLALMAGSFAGVLTIVGLRHFYGLVPPPLLGWVSALIIAMSSMLALESWWRWRHRQMRRDPPYPSRGRWHISEATAGDSPGADLQPMSFFAGGRWLDRKTAKDL